jgi:hypothetical protein
MTRLSIVLLAATMIAACSSQPRPSEPRAGGTIAAPTASQSSAPAAAGAATSSAQSSNGTASAQPLKKIPSEFKLRRKNGQIYYCRKETVLGSHFERTICLTEEEFAAAQKEQQRARDDLERAQKVCGGNVCGSNN